MLNIPEHILHRAGLTEREALIGFACWLFDSDRLDFNGAAQLANLTRPEFEAALLARNLPIIHYSAAEYEQDRATLTHLQSRAASGEH